MAQVKKAHGNYEYDPSRIWTLDSQGFSKREIAAKLGCSLATVYYHLNGYNYQKRITFLTNHELIAAEKHTRALIDRQIERLRALRAECKQRGLKRPKGNKVATTD